MDVTAILYEIDSLSWTLVDTAHVQADGSYLLGYSGLSNEGSAPEVAIEFRLSYEDNERAFYIEDGGSAGTIYSYWHPDAGPDNPYAIRQVVHTLPTAYFGGPTAAYDNLEHQAALVFASMVDATRVWHAGERWVGDTEDGYPSPEADPVPFQLEEYGPLAVRFPKGSVASGYGRSPTEIDIGAPGKDTDGDGIKDAWTKWHNGNLTAHEYGHALHQRTWEAGYGYDGDFAQSWSTGSYEEPFIAFKEAWANLVSAATFEQNGTDHSDDGSCSANDVDPASDRPYGTFDEGDHYPGNLSWLLCDWHDWSPGDDPDIPGRGDHFAAELYSMWSNLKGTWEGASTDQREQGLGAWDYLDYYLGDRKGIAAVGADEHLRYLKLITELAYQNGIGEDILELALNIFGDASRTWGVGSSSGFYSGLPWFFRVVAPNSSNGELTASSGARATP